MARSRAVGRDSSDTLEGNAVSPHNRLIAQLQERLPWHSSSKWVRFATQGMRRIQCRKADLCATVAALQSGQPYGPSSMSDMHFRSLRLTLEGKVGADEPCVIAVFVDECSSACVSLTPSRAPGFRTAVTQCLAHSLETHDSRCQTSNSKCCLRFFSLAENILSVSENNIGREPCQE